MSISKSEYSQGRGKSVDQLVETVSKSERGERRRERINRLVEAEPKSEVGEGGREVGAGECFVETSTTEQVGEIGGVE